MSKIVSTKQKGPWARFYHLVIIPLTVALTFFSARALQDLQDENPYRPQKISSRSPRYGLPIHFDRPTFEPALTPELEASLQTPIDLVLNKVTIDEAFSLIGKKSGLTLQLDDAAQEIFEDADFKLSFNAQPIPVGDALFLLDLATNGALRREGPQLVLGDLDRWQEPRKLGCYDITPFAKRAHVFQEMRWRHALETGTAFLPIDDSISHCGAIFEDGRTDYTQVLFARLVDRFLSALNENSFNEIEPAVWVESGVLFVRATAIEHERLQILLEGLCQNALNGKDYTANSLPSQHFTKIMSRSPSLLEARLQERVTPFRLPATKLEEALKAIAKRAKINLFIPNLDEFNQSIGSFQFKDETWGEAFQSVLKHTDFLAIPVQNTLVLTIDESLSRHQRHSLKIVNVKDLLYSHGQAHPRLSPEDLFELLFEKTNKKVVEEGCFMRIYGAQLVLYQSEMVHKQVASFLAAFRSGSLSQPSKDQDQEDR